MQEVNTGHYGDLYLFGRATTKVLLGYPLVAERPADRLSVLYFNVVPGFEHEASQMEDKSICFLLLSISLSDQHLFLMDFKTISLI